MLSNTGLKPGEISLGPNGTPGGKLGHSTTVASKDVRVLEPVMVLPYMVTRLGRCDSVKDLAMAGMGEVGSSPWIIPWA